MSELNSNCEIEEYNYKNGNVYSSNMNTHSGDSFDSNNNE